MNKILALAAVSMLVFVVGCGSKRPPAQASSNVTNVAPPPQPTLPVAPVTNVTSAGGATDVVNPGPAAEATAGKPVAGQKYVVKRGDTLWGIASRTYGDGKKLNKIVAANPSIKGPNDLKAGQTIILP